MTSTHTKSSQDFGYIRFFHTLPTEQNYSLFLDDKPFQKEWLYEDFTPYKKCSSGQHTLTLKQLGETLPFYEKRINVKAQSAFTYVLADHPKKELTPHLFCLEDTKKVLNGNHCCIRLGHFSKCVDRAQLQSGSEHLFFKNISYANLSHYMPIEAKIYPLQFVQVDDETVVTTLPAHRCKQGRLYTFYFIGDGSKTYPYKLVPTIDGPSFLTFKKPSSARS